jgi:2-polyprenyl-3-methyl-5-hydroxy-6-metoxy-1,4-benzoquinol methylase
VNFNCDNITLYGDDGAAVFSGPRFYRCARGGCGQLYTNGSIEKTNGFCHCGSNRIQSATHVTLDEQEQLLSGTIPTFDWEMDLIRESGETVQMLGDATPALGTHHVAVPPEAPVVGNAKPKILVAIPGFAGIQPECQESYASMMYHSGRKLSDRYDLGFKVITKREQFRARNHIVNQALASGFDYLLMLDDDHIVPVDLVERLMNHMDEHPEFGMLGVLYYQRGGTFDPVVMKRLRPDDPEDWSFRFYRQHEDVIANPGLHEVDMVGGGCMMFRTEVFAKLMPPFFAPEIDAGTDIQICCRLRDAGVRIACDTSIELGHLANEKQVITSRTIGSLYHKIAAINKQLHQDVMDYLGMSKDELERAIQYAVTDTSRAEKWRESVGHSDAWEDIQRYYQEHGEWHIVNLLYWNLSKSDPIKELAFRLMDGKVNSGDRVLDYGPGIGHLTIPYLEHGCLVDVAEVENSPTMSFLQYRSNRLGLYHNLNQWDIGFSGLPLSLMIPRKYKCCFLVSVLEHLHNPYTILEWITEHMEVGGYLLCDYAQGNDDESDPQHLMRYDPSTMHNYMRSLGWEVSPESMYLFIYRGK